MRTMLVACGTVAALLAAGVHAAELTAVVHKPAADVYAEPRLDAPKVKTLQRNAEVKLPRKARRKGSSW